MPSFRSPLRKRVSWRQYSISTLLIALTVLCTGLALMRNRAERQRRIVAAIDNHGGWVRYDFEPEDGGPGELPGPDWLCRAVGVDYFADAVAVGVGGSGVSDADCAKIAELTDLRSLSIGYSPITDAGLVHLAGLTDLQELYLIGGKITDVGVAHLAGLNDLHTLRLTETNVGDAGIAHLAGLTKLQSLYLLGTRVTDKGLPCLAKLKNLKELNLIGTEVTDAGLPQLAALKNLESLSLYDTRVTEQACAWLHNALPECQIRSPQTVYNPDRREGAL